MITIEKEGQAAPTDSIMEMMMLTAGPGDEVTVEAMGLEAEDALKAVTSLIKDGFGEDKL